ncbi:MAG: hypothetical protein AAFP22_07550 [Planctomycetota bacterium]
MSATPEPWLYPGEIPAEDAAALLAQANVAVRPIGDRTVAVVATWPNGIRYALEDRPGKGETAADVEHGLRERMELSLTRGGVRRRLAQSMSLRPRARRG